MPVIRNNMEKTLKMAVKYFVKIFSTVLIVLIAVLVFMTASPIYRFAEPATFQGDSIYNPYSSFDSSLGWKKSNFHTHTKVDIGINECPYYSDTVWNDYKKYGYDILGFSNHNALTEFPDDASRQIWLYEHGYNPLKFHKLVFLPENEYFEPDVFFYDNILPIFPSQKQFMFDLLRRDADFVVFNHPDRTLCVSTEDMQKLTGYRFIEAFSGKPTKMRHWDEALSSGHYSYCLLNDDCHFSGHPRKIAIRCSWLNTPSYSYKDVKKTLLAGCYYSMTLPEWAEGTPEEPGFYERFFPEEKIENNLTLPRIEDISLSRDTIKIALSEPTLYIKVLGNGGRILDSLADVSSTAFVLSRNEPYARMEIAFPEGVKIFTNAFARYDGNLSSLFSDAPHPIRIGATVAFNFLILIILSFLGYCIALIWRNKRRG